MTEDGLTRVTLHRRVSSPSPGAWQTRIDGPYPNHFESVTFIDAESLAEELDAQARTEELRAARSLDAGEFDLKDHFATRATALREAARLVREGSDNG